MNYGSQSVKQKKKMLNSSAKRFRTKVGVTSIKVLLILSIAVIVSGACLILGAAQGIIASAPDISAIDVSPTGYASKIYDCDGSEIQSLSASGANRIPVDISQVPMHLQHAFVAIEDERFYEHNGIDIRGIFRAAYNTLSGGGLSQGASTLTQQLIKNNIFNAYNETTIEKIKRKIQEQYLAVKLETLMSKDEILNDYLNTINLGNGYYGVQAAANGYFGKDVSELSLSECAVIASITQNPTRLNPIRFPMSNQERQQKVLKNMLEQGYISESEYSEAVSDDVYSRIESNDIEKGSTSYSFFVDALIDQLIDDLMTQKGYTETQATNLIYKGGLQINSTQDTAMQNIAEQVINTPEYYTDKTEFSISYSLSVKDSDGKISNYYQSSMQNWYRNTKGITNFSLIQSDENKAKEYIEEFKNAMVPEGATILYESSSFTMQPQVSFTLMDPYTGQVKVIVGGRGDKSASRTLNRATSTTRQPGSSIKPLAAYGPALDMGAITLATPIDDAPYSYSNGQSLRNNIPDEYRGIMNPRFALETSQNIPAVKVITMITPQVGFNYLESFGISSLVSPQNPVNGSHDVVQPLAIGGMTLGVHNIDMTAAFATIANGGTYTAPIYYTSVYDYKGELVLDNSSLQTHQVLKKQTAWLLTSALQSVVETGTATAAKVKSQPTAGKTGTTQTASDKWFCGFTPYYAASIWIGYDDNSRSIEAASTHTSMWSAIMEGVHASKNLETGTFTKPEGIVELKVCSQSGKLPVAGLCDNDPRGSTIVTEFFSSDNQPSESCDVHVRVNICNDSDLVASASCTNVSSRVFIKKSSEGMYAQDAPYAITSDMLSHICTLADHKLKDNTTVKPGAPTAPAANAGNSTSPDGSAGTDISTSHSSGTDNNNNNSSNNNNSNNNNSNNNNSNNNNSNNNNSNNNNSNNNNLQ